MRTAETRLGAANESYWGSMKKYFAIVIVAALASAVVAMVVPRLATPKTTTDSRVYLMNERALLLQGYLERYANEHFNYYPPADEVQMGHMWAPLWPEDPWTGQPLTPGTGVGQYEYTPDHKHLRYSLVVHYPGGKIVLRCAVPYTRKKQNDHRTREGLELVQQYIEKWSRSHGHTYPDPAQVDANGSVGKQSGIFYWPHDPWTHQGMANRHAWGNFTYKVTANHRGYTLTAHYSRTGFAFKLLGGTLAKP